MITANKLLACLKAHSIPEETVQSILNELYWQSKTPILDAIRLLIKVDGHATIPKIRQMLKMDLQTVLHVVAENKDLLRMNGGKIYGFVRFTFKDLVTHGQRKLYNPYTVDDYGYHLFDALEFVGEDDLKKKYDVHAYGGGIGDVHHYSGTKDCPELREELHARGFIQYERSMADLENFWKE